jgi:hypothetical protein
MVRRSAIGRLLALATVATGFEICRTSGSTPLHQKITDGKPDASCQHRDPNQVQVRGPQSQRAYVLTNWVRVSAPVEN